MSNERLIPCSGSGRAPSSVWRGICICAACGVRTFPSYGGVVQPHKTTRLDVAEFKRRGPRVAVGSR